MPVHELVPSPTTPKGFTGLRVTCSGKQKYLTFNRCDGTGRLKSKADIKIVRSEAKALEAQWQRARLEHNAKQYLEIHPPALNGHIYYTGLRGLQCLFKPTKTWLHLTLQVCVGSYANENSNHFGRSTTHIERFNDMWEQCVEVLAQFRGVELPQAWIDAKPSLVALRKLGRATAKHYQYCDIPEGLQF